MFWFSTLTVFSQYNNWGTRFLLILIYSIYLEFKIEFSITKKTRHSLKNPSKSLMFYFILAEKKAYP